MSRRTAQQVRTRKEMAKKVALHHFGKGVKKLEYQPEGATNFVFDVSTKNGDFIIRIATARTKINDFYKEQWATVKAREHGLPVPQILEVGNGIIPYPFMVQEKLQGKEAVDHPDRLHILEKLGSLARELHTIETEGFGSVFDWSKNKLSRSVSWPEYMDKELDVTRRLAFLKKHSFLPAQKFRHLSQAINKIRKWKMKPCLNHCDLRLKNVIVNEDAKIIGLIDWENCSSNMAPYWDLSIALHDLSIDGKQRFLQGYKIDTKEFEKMSFALTAFNIINYIPYIEKMVHRKEKNNLALYKLRLNGSLDLFSL